VKTTRRLVRARLPLPVGGGGIFIQTGARERPRFFPFQTGRWYSRHPPFPSISNGGTRCPRSTLFCFERGGVNTPPPLSFCFKWGQRESHALPPVSFVYPPVMGGIPSCGIDQWRRCGTHTPPPFLFVYPPTDRGIPSLSSIH